MALKYYVLILDIIDSTIFPDRDILTEKLDQATVCVNKEYSRDCLAPFEITRGEGGY